MPKLSCVTKGQACASTCCEAPWDVSANPEPLAPLYVGLVGPRPDTLDELKRHPQVAATRSGNSVPERQLHNNRVGLDDDFHDTENGVCRLSHEEASQ